MDLIKRFKSTVRFATLKTHLTLKVLDFRFIAKEDTFENKNKYLTMKVSLLLIVFFYILNNSLEIYANRIEHPFYENDHHNERYLLFGWFTDMFKRISHKLSSVASANTVYKGVKKVGSQRRDKRGRKILMDLYKSTGGKSWTSRAGWGEDWTEVCDWSGISCNDFIITKVELSKFTILIAKKNSQLNFHSRVNIIFL